MEIQKIPLWVAIIININVIIGAGIFVYAPVLAGAAGMLSVFSFATVACIVLPLVLVVAQVSRLFPKVHGGIYVYSKELISPLGGLVAGLGYFLSKSVSIAVLTTVFATYAQNVFPSLAGFHPKVVSLSTLALLCFLNFLGAKFGGRLQLLFVILKLLPILFAIFFAGFIFDSAHFTMNAFDLAGFRSALPFALYPMLGFETCCAIGHTIAGGNKNVSKVVVTSFFMVATVYTLFQISLFSVLGSVLGTLTLPFSAYADKLAQVFPVLSATAKPFLNSAVMVSVVGSGYGILYANCWNIFAIAEEMGDGGFWRLLRHKNTFGVPTYSVLLEAAVTTFCLLMGFSIQWLGRMTVLGMVVTYFLTTWGLLLAYRGEMRSQIALPMFISLLGILSCSYLGYHCIKDLVRP